MTGAILEIMTDSTGEVLRAGAARGDGIGAAGPEHAGEIAALAAATFPLASPPSVTEDDVRAYVDEFLSPARFAEYLADPGRTLLVARRDDSATAYALLVHEPPADPAVAAVIERRPSTEISEFYADSAAPPHPAEATLKRDSARRRDVARRYFLR